MYIHYNWVFCCISIVDYHVLFFFSLCVHCFVLNVRCHINSFAHSVVHSIAVLFFVFYSCFRTYIFWWIYRVFLCLSAFVFSIVHSFLSPFLLLRRVHYVWCCGHCCWHMWFEQFTVKCVYNISAMMNVCTVVIIDRAMFSYATSHFMYTKYIQTKSHAYKQIQTERWIEYTHAPLQVKQYTMNWTL